MNTRFVIASLTLLIVACTPQTPTPDNGAASSVSSATSSMSDSYIGLTVEQAEAKAEADGVPFRVVMRDGEALAVTMDFLPGRINAVVENNIVVDYGIEGEEGGVEPMGYNQNSWRMMIPPSCMSFFDGCNNCQRAGQSDTAACTKKFCQEYEQPKCLDME